MKKIYRSFLALVMSLLATTVLSASLQQGKIAYDNGDYKTAYKEWLPFANKGHDLAAFSVGDLYQRGLGVEKNIKEAVRWYTVAAKQGRIPAAAYRLGLLFMRGEGVLQDHQVAARWYLQAAELGFPPAQSKIATMYYHGKGLQKNQKEAMKWLALAAEQGEPYSQHLLGYSFFLGEGVEKDYVQAHKWLNLAVYNGFKGEASELREFVESKMTEHQLFEARKLAQTWVQTKN